MIKTFCDCCGNEIPKDVKPSIISLEFPRADGVKKPYRDTMVIGSGTTHLCKGCIVDAANRADDRPPIAPPSSKRKSWVGKDQRPPPPGWSGVIRWENSEEDTGEHPVRYWYANARRCRATGSKVQFFLDSGEKWIGKIDCSWEWLDE